VVDEADMVDGGSVDWWVEKVDPATTPRQTGPSPPPTRHHGVSRRPRGAVDQGPWRHRGWVKGGLLECPHCSRGQGRRGPVTSGLLGGRVDGVPRRSFSCGIANGSDSANPQESYSGTVAPLKGRGGEAAGRKRRKTS